jgi:hypothetical protein
LVVVVQVQLEVELMVAILFYQPLLQLVAVMVGAVLLVIQVDQEAAQELLAVRQHLLLLLELLIKDLLVVKIQALQVTVPVVAVELVGLVELELQLSTVLEVLEFLLQLRDQV